MKTLPPWPHLGIVEATHTATMTDSSNRYGDQPLGKSVEEIEREGGNLENSPVQGEDRRRDDGLVVPAVIGGTTSGAPGAVVGAGLLADRTGGADDGTARSGDSARRDDSET
ncbi:hypothetical protein GCM10008955_14520 [Deinococcus malanensis]|uniref:Uncharacterized protein n=2 Tax=Deinococcus malanensis TaxID=1706855 RepID=A0ABQ2ERZ4_9DEIO|nr:hypothetical protein GCM10008955_14520 [Deinococcus malanensis]